MMGFRTIVLSVITVAFITSYSMPVCAQVDLRVSKSERISVSLAMEKDHAVKGKKSMADVIITNITNNDTCLSTGILTYRVHIERDGVEPPKTELHRHLLGDF